MMNVTDRLRGQTTVEFALIAITAILFMLGIAQAAMASFAATNLDYGISILGTELPEGWDASDDAQVVKGLMAATSTIDPARITVNDAEITVEDVHGTDTGDTVAAALGGEMATRTGKYLHVKATVTYDIKGVSGSILPLKEVSRTIDRTLSLEKRYEVS